MTAFASLTILNGVTGLLAPSIPGTDLLDGDPDDLELAFAVERDRSQLDSDELDELFTQW